MPVIGTKPCERSVGVMLKEAPVIKVLLIELVIGSQPVYLA